MTRSFGTIDRTPAMFEEVYGVGSGMSSILTIVRRRPDRSWAACRVTFEYQPKFLDRARRQFLAELSDAQRLAYEKAEASLLAQRPASTTQRATDPSQIDKHSPFRLPYADGEHLYVASVGHFTIGWRSYADWSVTLQEVSADALIESGSFAIGMWKGRITRTSIEEL